MKYILHSIFFLYTHTHIYCSEYIILTLHRQIDYTSYTMKQNRSVILFCIISYFTKNSIQRHDWLSINGSVYVILIVGMNQEAIQRVAQNLPHHMLHSLSQVANQTPHHYPPHTPGTASAAGYGGVHTYPNTPYTPSGQTPFMTPYQTPHHTPHHGQPTPRYGQQTPSHHQGPFVHPPPPSMTPGHHRSTQSHRPTPPLSTPSGDPTDWKKAAEAWARLKSNPRVS